MSNGDNLNLTLNDSVLNYRKTLQPEANASFYISREDLHAVLTGQVKMADLVKRRKPKLLAMARYWKKLLPVWIISICG